MVTTSNGVVPALKNNHELGMMVRKRFVACRRRGEREREKEREREREREVWQHSII